MRDAPDRFAAEEFGSWRDLICAVFLSLTPESQDRKEFSGMVTRWPLGQWSLARIESQRQAVRRTENDIARAPVAGYYANLQLRAISTMRQGRGSTVLHPGDLALVRTTEPFEFGFGSDFRQLSFFIPAGLVEGRLPTATRLATDSGVGAAVRHVLTTVTRRPDRAQRLAVHAAGLLALAFDEPPAPVRAPRTHAAVLADIEEHLLDDDLSPLATARRLGLSARSVHGLFAGRELSYSATVRHRRLQVAMRQLRDPALRHLRVIDVATEAGFVNVTAFHRAFLREFGRTPGDYRNVTAAGSAVDVNDH